GPTAGRIAGRINRRIKRRTGRGPWAALVILAAAMGWAPGASATVMISEIFYDAEGSDDGHVFVELAGPPGTLLDGWQVEGVNGFDGGVGPAVLLSGSIPASGLFVLADRTGGGSVFVPGADLVANFDFQNGPDSIVLRDAFGIVDAVGYGSFTSAHFFAGEGSPASDPPGGSSVARWFADVDTDDNAMDFHVLGVPTPGSADFLAVPEPGTGVLLALGLLGIAATGRRSPGIGERRMGRVG
ncbi:MAG: lamin tail domain-containing protein, partial [Myxococcota bacterium]|nr:lamin tail domain-containing protein [Myxococcota bacterium]